MKRTENQVGEHKLYRYKEGLYRAEPAAVGSCRGCAFAPMTSPEGCDPFRIGADCFNRDVVAKLLPPNLPVPASVTIVELES